MIRVRHVSKEYPRTGLAVADVSLQVAKGEFMFLTGPSGAGKSTLLKLLYLDERPTRGEIRVAGLICGARGVPRRAVAMLRRKLGVIFQDFRLLDDRTVHANVAFALERHRRPVGFCLGPREPGPRPGRSDGQGIGPAAGALGR